MNSNPFRQNEIKTNMTLPDQLSEVRSLIKKLKANEAALVAEIKQIGNCVGKSHMAEVVVESQRRMNTKKVKDHLGDRLDEFYEENEVTKVRLKELNPYGEDFRGIEA